MSSKIGCLDACFRGARRSEEFQKTSGNALTDEDVVELLKMSQIGVLVIIILHGFIHVLWTLTTIVPGFVLFDGAVGTYSAYTHAGWWLMIDFIVLAMGIASTFFGINYAAEVGVLERGVERTVTWLQSYMIVLVFAIASHLIHVGFSLVEISDCTSTLCTQQYWCLVTLIVMLFVLIFLMGWLIVRVYAFTNNLNLALAYGRIDMSLTTTTTTTTTTTMDAPSLPNSAPIGRSAAMEESRRIRASRLAFDPRKHK